MDIKIENIFQKLEYKTQTSNYWYLTFNIKLIIKFQGDSEYSKFEPPHFKLLKRTILMVLTLIILILIE